MILLFLWLFVSLIVLGMPCLVFGVGCWYYPSKWLHQKMWWWYVLWCNQLGRLTQYYVPDLSYTEEEVSKNKPFVLVANHYCWLDILILFATVFRKRPFVFVMKRSLGYVPLVGILSILVGYPLIDRGRAARRNRDILLSCAEKAYRYQYGIAIFPEGTRKVKSGVCTDYQHLLRPKWMGTETLVSQMGSDVLILDTSIVYEKKRPSLWDFFWGSVGRVSVEVKGYNVDAKEVKHWLIDLWPKKDQQIALMKSQFQAVAEE